MQTTSYLRSLDMTRRYDQDEAFIANNGSSEEGTFRSVCFNSGDQRYPGSTGRV